MAEWFPEKWMGGGSILLTWQEQVKGFLRYLGMGWIDNFAYTLILGENTVTFFFCIFLSFQRGEFIGFIGTPYGPTVG